MSLARLLLIPLQNTEDSSASAAVSQTKTLANVKEFPLNKSNENEGSKTELTAVA